MKKILLASILFLCGCGQCINISDNSSLKIIQVTQSFSDEKYYYYKVKDKDGYCYSFFSEEKFLVGDSVKIVKVEPQ